jgi:hypothetical protein
MFQNVSDTDDKFDLRFETTSNDSKGSSVLNTAQNMLGIGKGSKFNPVKASVLDDEDEDAPEE